MKAKPEEIVRAFAIQSPRLVVLCGPNVSRCETIVRDLVSALPDGAERVELGIGDLSDNPARLADEAASISLFGTPRYLVLRLHGGEAMRSANAIETLLASPVKGDPLFVIAPGMSDKTALAKAITASPDALLAICYDSETKDVIPAIRNWARDEGLVLAPNLASEIARRCGNDLALARIEVEKIALYLDATPATPQTVTAELIDQLAADNDEENLGVLIHSAMNGEGRVLARELATATAIGLNGVGLLRVMMMHLAKLAALRSRADGGASVSSLATDRSVFWKDKQHFERQLHIWSSARLARLIERALMLEIDLKSSGTPENILVEQFLLNVSRSAAR
ncbi:MAG: hypothetical protein U5J78_06165 [Parasphingorhabdus sp.]|nr:hypothetical protein [Parasphingorhabdus sp.]